MREAKSEVDQALKIDPEDEEARRRKVEIMIALGEYEEAMELAKGVEMEENVRRAKREHKE